MKRFLFSFFAVTFLLISCSENFELVNPQDFNEKIANRTDIKTPEELIITFYNYIKGKERRFVTVESKKLSGNNYEITLINENLPDVSVTAEKIVMEATLNKQSWKITNIKRNWKCQPGRGDTTWGTNKCK